MAADLSRRGLAGVGTDDLAFRQDSGGVRTAPPGPDNQWLLACRSVWSRPGIGLSTAGAHAGGAVSVCGIAGNQAEMPDLFGKVFLLVIGEETHTPRRAAAPRPGSPVRAGAVRRQIREGRRVLQAQMPGLGAIPPDAPPPPEAIADSLLAHPGPGKLRRGWIPGTHAGPSRPARHTGRVCDRPGVPALRRVPELTGPGACGAAEARAASRSDAGHAGAGR